MDEPWHGITVREPYPSEIDYFWNNQHIPAMSTEDYKVIFNPYVNIDDNARRSLLLNETSRAFMKKYNFSPKFGLIQEQQDYLSKINNGKPYGSEQDMRETIASRLLSGDPSAGQPNPEQIIFMNMLKKFLGVNHP